MRIIRSRSGISATASGVGLIEIMFFPGVWLVPRSTARLPWLITLRVVEGNILSVRNVRASGVFAPPYFPATFFPAVMRRVMKVRILAILVLLSSMTALVVSFPTSGSAAYQYIKGRL